MIFSSCTQMCKHPDSNQASSINSSYVFYSKSSGATQAECDASRVESKCLASGDYSPAIKSTRYISCKVVGQACAYPSGTGISVPTGNMANSTVTGYVLNTAVYPSVCKQETRMCLASGQWNGTTPLYTSCSQKCVHPTTNQPVDINTQYTYYKIQSGSQAQCDASKITSICQSTGMFSNLEATRYQSCSPVIECPSGQHMENGTCTANSKTCLVQNGFGQQTWNSTTGAYNQCTDIKCLKSHYYINGQCSIEGSFCRNSSGELVPCSNPTPIYYDAELMYQEDYVTANTLPNPTVQKFRLFYTTDGNIFGQVMVFSKTTGEFMPKARVINSKFQMTGKPGFGRIVCYKDAFGTTYCKNYFNLRGGRIDVLSNNSFDMSFDIQECDITDNGNSYRGRYCISVHPSGDFINFQINSVKVIDGRHSDAMPYSTIDDVITLVLSLSLSWINPY